MALQHGGSREKDAERDANEAQQTGQRSGEKMFFHWYELFARRRIISDAQANAARVGVGQDAHALIERLECTPLQQALDACNGNEEEAEARLGAHRQLIDNTAVNRFANKMKAVVRNAATMEAVLERIRRKHRSRLAQVEKLSSLVQRASQNKIEFAKTVAHSSEEEVEALSFAVNSSLISGLGADAVPWSRFARELDKIGITERHSALSRPEGFFKELHAQECEAQEKLIREAVTSATSAMVNIAPALRPHLIEFGLALEDVLPVLTAACHTDWDEVTTLLDDPRLLVRQAAAVKCPTATFELSFHLHMEYSAASADLDGMKHKFAQQLGVSRMQIAVALSPSRNQSSRAKLKVATIDADAGSALIERLKSSKDTSAKVLGAQLLAFPVILGIQMNTHKNAETCNFHLLLASELRKKDSPALYATRHQDIDPSLFHTITVTMQDVLKALYAGKVLVVSHRWCDKAEPDPDGVQEQAIKTFLCEHPEIEYVWQDVRLLSAPVSAAQCRCVCACSLAPAVLVHAAVGAVESRGD